MSRAARKKVDKKSSMPHKLAMGDAMNSLKRLVGSQVRIAEALGLTPEHVSRMATGKLPVPPYVDAVAELLEALPPKDWPERWR